MNSSNVILGMAAVFSKASSHFSLCKKATRSSLHAFFFPSAKHNCFLWAGCTLSPKTALLIGFLHANRRHRRNSFTANKSVPTVQLPRKCILPLFLAGLQALQGPRGSCADCAFWQSPSLLSGRPSLWSGPIPDYLPQLHKLQNGFIMSRMFPMSQSMSVCSLLFFFF